MAGNVMMMMLAAVAASVARAPGGDGHDAPPPGDDPADAARRDELHRCDKRASKKLARDRLGYAAEAVRRETHGAYRLQGAASSLPEFASYVSFVGNHFLRGAWAGVAAVRRAGAARNSRECDAGYQRLFAALQPLLLAEAAQLRGGDPAAAPPRALELAAALEQLATHERVTNALSLDDAHDVLLPRLVALVGVALRDAAGRLVPNADAELAFTVRGPARLLALANGDPASHQAHGAAQIVSWKGLARAIVASSGGAGQVTVTVQAPGLQPASVTLEAR